jgi:peptide/nickel transport system permease protein
MTSAEPALDPPAGAIAAGAGGVPLVHGESPWRTAARRLWASKVGLAFLGVFLVVVAMCLAAPLYAKHVAHTGPLDTHGVEKVTVNGKKKDIVRPDGVPIGPTWHGRYFLGADGSNGRDVAVRLLYGGRNSLMIGGAAALLTALLSTVFALVAGYFRGVLDGVLSGVMNVIWAYPAILLGVALGTALAQGGLNLGFVSIAGDSKLIPILIIGVVYVPYMGRPLRGQVLSLREKEFVEAAEASGAGPVRIMFSEILPNLASTIIVFLPLMIANAILLEAALSFVGAGVRPPDPSWGSMISDGVKAILNAPHLAIVPGLMLVITVLSLNIFGDTVRDALDPRAEIKVGR